MQFEATRRSLSSKEYDLVVIGGGIFGACAAWDATLRGLTVALVEKGDFSGATSANHLKMIHGGIRYLQHMDLYRIRESCRERSALLRIAPHLSYPVPIAFPTYGHGMKGKEFLGAGFFLYDLLTYDRNRGIRDPGRRIPSGGFLGRRELERLFPGIGGNGLTGAAVFYDGQMYNPPRLALSFLRAAAERGADVSNYLGVTGFLRNGTRVHGVRVADILTGDMFDIRGKFVLNAAGPWADSLLEKTIGLRNLPKPVFSRDLGFVIPRAFPHEYGLACQIGSKDDDAILSRGGRHIFLMPWRGHTLVGCWHVVYNGSPDEIVVTEKELEGYVEDINRSYPAFSLRTDDITMVNTGLTLFEENESGSKNLRFGKRSLLIDHDRRDNIQGLVTLIGVRATTARGMAERAIDLVFQKMGCNFVESATSSMPIYGGQIDCFDRFVTSVGSEGPDRLSPKVLRALVHNYGCRYRDVLKYVDVEAEWADTIGNSTVLKAEVIHAVHEEMSRRLEDVVVRRTDLGSGGNPGEESLRICAELMGKELGWSSIRIREEIEEVNSHFLGRGGFKYYKTLQFG